MIGVWSVMGSNAQILFWNLLNQLVHKSPELPEKQPDSAPVLEAAPPPLKPLSVTSEQDVQAVVVRRVTALEATSRTPSTDSDEDGDIDADDTDEEDEDDEADDEPAPTKRSALGRLNISLHPEKQKYYVRVYRHGKTHWAGYFLTPEEAVGAATRLRERLGLPFLPVWQRKPPKAE